MIVKSPVAVASVAVIVFVGDHFGQRHSAQMEGKSQRDAAYCRKAERDLATYKAGRRP